MRSSCPEFNDSRNQWRRQQNTVMSTERLLQTWTWPPKQYADEYPGVWCPYTRRRIPVLGPPTHECVSGQIWVKVMDEFEDLKKKNAFSCVQCVVWACEIFEALHDDNLHWALHFCIWSNFKVTVVGGKIKLKVVFLTSSDITIFIYFLNWFVCFVRQHDAIFTHLLYICNYAHWARFYGNSAIENLFIIIIKCMDMLLNVMLFVTCAFPATTKP